MSGNLKMEARGTEGWLFVFKRLQSETRRNAIDALTYVGVKIAISGRKIAKPGDKRRAVEKNPDFRRMVRERKKWARQMGVSTKDLNAQPIYPHYIIAHRQRGEPSRLGTFNPQADPRRKIENRGLAQKMWNILYGQLASLKGTANVTMHGGNLNAVTVKRSIQGSVSRYTASLNLSIRLNYLEKAYPGIGQSAISNGQASLINELNRRQQLSIDRANKSKAAA